MRSFYRWFVFTSFFLSPCAWAADWLVLTNFTLIDSTGAPARKVACLKIRDGLIVDIDSAINVDPPKPMDVVTSVDLEGAFVIPGLIDSHVHVARFPDALGEAERILAEAVRGGVTAVRDMGGDARALGEIVRASIRGESTFSTIVYSGVYGGPSLFADQRITAFAPGYPSGGAPWARAITQDTDVTLAIAETKGTGASGVKIYANLDRNLTEKIIREAGRQNLRTWAHGTVFPTRPSDLVDQGINSLSHAPYLVWEAASNVPDDYGARIAGAWQETPPDHPKIVALFEKMKEKGVSLDATLYVFRHMANFSPQIQAAWTKDAFAWGKAVTALAHKMGVKITAGTDWFEPQMGELPHTHEELAILVEEAGLSPMDAIIAGTRNGAEALGLLSERGTVEIGKAADLLILKENPLDGIRNTTKILMVAKDGKLVKPMAW